MSKMTSVALYLTSVLRFRPVLYLLHTNFVLGSYMQLHVQGGVPTDKLAEQDQNRDGVRHILPVRSAEGATLMITELVGAHVRTTS